MAELFGGDIHRAVYWRGMQFVDPNKLEVALSGDYFRTWRRRLPPLGTSTANPSRVVQVSSV